MSIDTEMPQRKSEAPHVEQQQELADVCWRSSRRLRQVPRAISRCHSGFAGVLKRDRDFPFFFVNFVFRGGFGRHVGLINDYWPP